MTREEAIRELREDKALYETDNCHAGDGSPDGDLLEALDMAIEALSDRMIDRVELFNKLAILKAPPEANEYKAEVFRIINEM